MSGPLRTIGVFLSFYGATIASRVRHTHLHSATGPESFKSQSSLFSSMFSGSTADAPGNFVKAFQAGWKAAVAENNDEHFSKDQKRYEFEDGMKIKTWRGINKALAPLRKSILSDEKGEELINNLFAPKILDKFWGGSEGGGGKSGAKLFILPYDPVSGYSYILKGEDRDFVKQGVWPIIDKYAARMHPDNAANLGPCEASTMMKVLMVFEPLNVHKSVNGKVWMLFTNVNTLPMFKGNHHQMMMYDIKHSREISRCSSDGTDDEGSIGYLGDFLREWEWPLRQTIQNQYRQNSSTVTVSFAGAPEYSKTTCLLKALSRDFAVLDSAYPNAKLVDQSALITVVQLRGPDSKPRVEHDSEKEIVDRSNNILRIQREDGTTWHMIIGIIDLFANKKAQKWKRFQSHTSHEDYIFEMKKFSMYPFQLGCLFQYMFYYKGFHTDKAKKDVSYRALVNDNYGKVGSSWPQCYGKGDPYETVYDYDHMTSSSVTSQVHAAIQNPEQTCSLLNTCHNMLVSYATPALVECCQKGHYNEDLLGKGHQSC